MIRGGKVPGGNWRRIVCDTAVICAFAVSKLAVGCRKIFTTAWPLTRCIVSQRPAASGSYAQAHGFGMSDTVSPQALPPS